MFWCFEVYGFPVERVIEPICGGSSVQRWVVGCVPKETRGMSSSCDCVVCEHAAIVVRGESGFDLFWGAAWVNTLGVVFLDGGAAQCLLGDGRGQVCMGCCVLCLGGGSCGFHL